MEIGLLLIIIGIVLALLINWTLGVIVILVGLVLILAPRLRAGRNRGTTPNDRA